MSSPFGFEHLYGYEGELNSVDVKPTENVDDEFTLTAHDNMGGGYQFGYPQVSTNNGINPDLILMRFTGLQDCTGKDVYEGDVVKVDDHAFLLCREVDVIQWRSGAFFIGDSDDMASLHNAQAVNTNTVRLEVIGDIYTTPDLLT